MDNFRRIRKVIVCAATLAVVLFVFGAPAHANVTASPSSANIPNQAVGSTSAPVGITLTNTSKRSTTITGASVSAAQFSYSGLSLPLTLNRGQSVVIAITFSPSAVQTYSAMLTITSSFGSTTGIALAGTGIQAQPTTQAPAITSSAGTSFTVGAAGSFTVTTTGSPVPTLSESGTLPSGVTFNATSGALSGTPAAATGGTYPITLTAQNGVGANATQSLMLIVNQAPAITMQPASQSVIAGQTATFSAAATGTGPMSFQWQQNGTAISGATSSTYITPATSASSTGSKFTVTVTNIAGSATSTAATLTVNAATLLLNSSSTTLSFGSLNLSTTASQNVTLTNAGNSSVTISNVSIAGAGFNASGIPAGQILTPGSTATLNVSFTPAATGNVTGGVTVTSTATNSPDQISLSGVGLAAVVHSVALSWVPSTSTVIGYNTYSGTVSGGPYAKLTTVPVAATTYTDMTVQAGVTYYYVVTSVNSSNQESAYSNEISAAVP